MSSEYHALRNGEYLCFKKKVTYIIIYIEGWGSNVTEQLGTQALESSRPRFESCLYTN